MRLRTLGWLNWLAERSGTAQKVAKPFEKRITCFGTFCFGFLVVFFCGLPRSGLPLVAPKNEKKSHQKEQSQMAS